MSRLICFVSIFIITIANTFAQRKEVDSLLNLIQQTKDDKIKVEALAFLGESFYHFDLDSSILMSREAIKILNRVSQKGIEKDTAFILTNRVSVLVNLAAALSAKNETDTALVIYKECLSIREKLKDEAGKSIIYTNMAGIFKNRGDIEQALKYYFKCIALREKLKDEEGLCRVYINVAVLYRDQHQLESAMEYYLKSLKISKKINYERIIPVLYNNIGELYQFQQQHDSALHYFAEGIIYAQKQGHKYGESSFLNNMSISYRILGRLDEAIASAKGALILRKQVNAVNSLSDVYGTLALCYEKKNNINIAAAYADSAFHFAKQTGFPLKIKSAAELNYTILAKKGDYKTALKMLELKIEMSDSILNAENKEKSIKSKIQHEYERQALVDSIEYSKQKEVQRLQIQEQNAKLDKEKTMRTALVGGLMLTFVFSIFLYNRFRITKKQKVVIEQKERETQLQNQIIIQQKEIVEEKNKEITDSINYAKRIQDAILPSRYSLSENLKNGFVLYKPKDIVAGDFYWLESYAPPKVGATDSEGMAYTKAGATDDEHRNTGKIVFFAAADCTGHGVPGALVSVVCSNALSKAVLEEGITEPGKILDKTRALVVEKFSKSGDKDVKDGMDISLAALSEARSEGDAALSHRVREETASTKVSEVNSGEQSFQLQWAGANNPLWIIADENRADLSGFKNLTGLASTNGKALYEIKPNKQPIGMIDDPQPFTTHTIELQEGDIIYVFTDGYQDQFGGDKGKKFKASQLKELLLAIQHESMDAQKLILEEAFEKWRGGLEQIDDVCIIGVRV